jgi:hypothetical protein
MNQTVEIIFFRELLQWARATKLEKSFNPWEAQSRVDKSYIHIHTVCTVRTRLLVRILKAELHAIVSYVKVSSEALSTSKAYRRLRGSVLRSKINVSFVEVKRATLRSHFLRQLLDLGQADLASIRQTIRTTIKPMMRTNVCSSPCRSLSHNRFSEIIPAETFLDCNSEVAIVFL